MKVFTRFLMIFGLTALLSHPRAFASDDIAVAIGGISYNLYGKEQTAAVINWDGADNGKPYEGDIVIPSVVVYSGKTYPVTCIQEGAFQYCESLTSVTIPNTVTVIEGHAFCVCTSLTSVNIPNSVTSIEDYTFATCTSLTSVNIPNSVTVIGGHAFSSCESLTSVTIPNSVTSIESCAFYGCTSLASIDIPNSVTSIEDYVFMNCTSLTSVTIPNSVTSIGYGVFQGCSSLASATIPVSVTSIRDYAFFGCTSLTSVTVPNSVTSIGGYAFYACEMLSSIYVFAETPPEFGNGVFGQMDRSACTLYVPKGCKEAYASDDMWKDFANIVEIDVTGIEPVRAGGEESRTVKEIFTPDGARVAAPQRGVNIVRYSDGTTRKVLVK